LIKSREYLFYIICFRQHKVLRDELVTIGDTAGGPAGACLDRKTICAMPR